MDRDERALLAIAAASALVQALQTHLTGANKQQRQSAIKTAEVKLKKLRMVTDPSHPFTWSLHHDHQFIDVQRETKQNIKASLREMANRMQDGQSAIEAGADLGDLISMRYLALYGSQIDVPELPTLFLEYEDS